MRVLIDESLPRVLGRAPVGHEARTVVQMGWSSIDNGELIRRAAAAGFGALLTADQNLEYQQDISQAGIGVIVLRARSNRVEHISPLAPAVLEALDAIRPGEVVHVGA